MTQSTALSATEYFNAVAANYLAGTTAATARPLTFEEIESLIDSDIPSLNGYLLRDPEPGFSDVDLLVPATFTFERRSGADQVHGAKKAPREADGYVPDKSVVVGRRLDVEAVTAFRKAHNLRLFTTPAAEEAASLLGGAHWIGGEGRRTVYVPDEKATPLPLAPIFGSYATVSFAVPGVAPAALEAHMREVLARDFGVGMGRVVKVATSAVEERRVDVTDQDGRLVAVNVLDVEVGTLLRQYGQGITTRPSAGREVTVVIGD